MCSSDLIGNTASTNIAAGAAIISPAYSIDIEDQARALAFRFYYKVMANVSANPMVFANWAPTEAAGYEFGDYGQSATDMVEFTPYLGVAKTDGLYTLDETFVAHNQIPDFQQYTDSTNGIGADPGGVQQLRNPLGGDRLRNCCARCLADVDDLDGFDPCNPAPGILRRVPHGFVPDAEAVRLSVEKRIESGDEVLVGPEILVERDPVLRVALCDVRADVRSAEPVDRLLGVADHNETPVSGQSRDDRAEDVPLEWVCVLRLVHERDTEPTADHL